MCKIYQEYNPASLTVHSDRACLAVVETLNEMEERAFAAINV